MATAWCPHLLATCLPAVAVKGRSVLKTTEWIKKTLPQNPASEESYVCLGTMLPGAQARVGCKLPPAPVLLTSTITPCDTDMELANLLPSEN